jgi:hypothetical protein
MNFSPAGAAGRASVLRKKKRAGEIHLRISPATVAV